MIQEVIRRAVEDMSIALSGRSIAKQVDLYAELLSYYSPHEKVLQAIDQLIRTESKFPPPNAVIAAAEGMGARRSVTYDKYDDPRYPVQLLWRAFGILKRDGKSRAIEFMNDTRMPENDRKRVFDKLRYETDANYRQWVKDKIKKLKADIKNIGMVDEIPF